MSTETEKLVLGILSKIGYPGVTLDRLRDGRRRGLIMHRVRGLLALNLSESGFTVAQIGDAIGFKSEAGVRDAILAGRRYREGWHGPHRPRPRWKPLTHSSAKK